MGRPQTNVYIDGFNLYYGALKNTPYRWLDPLALCGLLFPRNSVNRIRYFTALVDARPTDLQQPLRQQTYIRALETLECVSVHYGQFQTRKTRMALAKPLPNGTKTVEVLKTEEKGSDVNLGSHLLMDAFNKDCQVAVVISNDADLKEPVTMARSLGVTVGIVNPHPKNKRSHDLEGNFFKQLRSGPLAGAQFAEELTDANGIFRRPSAWSAALNR
jgi:uncharacterized LabA/DUF88 family protein